MNKYNSQVESYIHSLAQRKLAQCERYQDSDRWSIYIPLQRSDIEGFYVEIFLMNDWISLSSIIMDNIEGRQASQFYEVLLRFGSYLNGLKLAISPDGTYVTLQAELRCENINHHILDDILGRFTAFYVKPYPQILKIANELRIRLRRNQDRVADSLISKLLKGKLFQLRPDKIFRSLPNENLR